MGKALKEMLADRKVACSCVESTVAERPARRTWQKLDLVERAAILEDAADRNELALPAWIGALQLGPDGKDRLGFGSEIERIARLVVVKAMHPVSVIEERRRCGSL